MLTIILRIVVIFPFFLVVSLINLVTILFRIFKKQKRKLVKNHYLLSKFTCKLIILLLWSRVIISRNMKKTLKPRTNNLIFLPNNALSIIALVSWFAISKYPPVIILRGSNSSSQNLFGRFILFYATLFILKKDLQSKNPILSKSSKNELQTTFKLTPEIKKEFWKELKNKRTFIALTNKGEKETLLNFFRKSRSPVIESKARTQLNKTMLLEFFIPWRLKKGEILIYKKNEESML